MLQDFLSKKIKDGNNLYEDMHSFYLKISNETDLVPKYVKITNGMLKKISPSGKLIKVACMSEETIQANGYMENKLTNPAIRQEVLAYIAS